MKFTTVFGVAALFMAPSATAWKLPLVDRADAAATPTEQPAPSGATSTGPPSGFPSDGSGGFPGGYPSGFPSGTGFPSGFPGHHHGHGGHEGPRHTGIPSGVPSGFPEGPSPTGGFPGGEGEGSFTIPPFASPTPSAGAGDVEEKGEYRRLHARQVRPVMF